MRLKNCLTLLLVVLLTLSLPLCALGYEFGGESVVYYDNYNSSHGTDLWSLDCADNVNEGLISELCTDDSWQWNFHYENSTACEEDFKKESLGGIDTDVIDSVDLASFCGHGLGNELTFNTEQDDWESIPSEQDLGDSDLEWLLTFTCNFLKGNMSDFGYAADGLHLICGYCTDMTITCNSGEVFAQYAMSGDTVKTAWFKYGLYTQEGSWENISRVFGAESCENDHLSGFGTVASDPEPYSSSPGSYTYWDRKLNW